MKSFQKKFKDEVKEYFERLESGLLLLEQDPKNHQVIEEIFRIMHSLKGSGGMFGFDLLSDVTHDLESLYEIFKSRKVAMNSEVINFTLKSIDGLDNLLVQEPTEEHRLLARQMKAETLQLIDRLVPMEKEVKLNGSVIEETSDNQAYNNQQTTYFISFVPDENIFINGTNPLYLIDELNALGECNIQICFDQLPELVHIDPLKCYTSWKMFIATCEDTGTLNDVFIFVSDQANIEIQKVADGNVVDNEQIISDFLDKRNNHEPWTPIELEKEEEEAILILEENKGEIKPETSQPAEVSKANTFASTAVDSIRVDSQKIDQYMNLVSELITIQSRLDLVSSKIKNPDLELVTEALDKISRQLRDNAFDMSLIPLNSIDVRFKRLIHDVSKALGKKVELVTIGLETELDKNIIEKLIEPLLHIIRNSLDHGIESSQDRVAKAKNIVGTITIKASTVGSYVQIEISDDGAGLNTAKIRSKAISKGLISENDKLSDQEIYNLIFEPGFSTSDAVTDVSGRGVGMEVVRRKVQEMRGLIKIESETDRFTRFILKLPLSLSIIDGLLTKVGGGYYVVPSSGIKKIYSVTPNLLKKEFRQVVVLEGNQVPYLNMHEEFYRDSVMPDNLFIITVSFENQVFGLVVDEVIHEYQAVIKPLGKLLKGQDIFSGASILGNGLLALVLDTNKIIQKYS
ncbi:MAG TPA: chemotaxis protein CheA [Prolixibacteraceae bacterium]|jgi:two-component system chemotaxis sensor kinase CheA|nr:chemotaxis protein CheA [Prolixibacteraceae bacterium]